MPGEDTVCPDVVIAPATPVIVPAVLSIVPGLKYVLAPPCFNRFPSVILFALTSEELKLKSN
jgi:hypothetical protein